MKRLSDVVFARLSSMEKPRLVIAVVFLTIGALIVLPGVLS